MCKSIERRDRLVDNATYALKSDNSIMTHALPNFSWNDIDTVLLDMDGTLLDLHYDYYFWFTHLPQRVQAIHGGDLEHIKTETMAQIMSAKGDQKWYDLNYWSEQFDVNVAALKIEIKDKIALLPNTLDFLNALQDANKRMVIATNAHPDSVHVKVDECGIGHYFEHIISGFKYGYAKENPHFWDALKADIGYDETRTLFADDNADVLHAAKRAGIAHVVGITEPDTHAPANTLEGHVTVQHVGCLITP